MSPPYKLVDMATGLDVPDFVGMDAQPGEFIEVYKGPSPSNPQARISGGALERPAEGGATGPTGPGPTGPTGPTGPVDPPVVTGGLFNPTTGAELQAAAQLAMDGPYLLMCDSRSRPVVSQQIVLKARDAGTTRHGILGNGMKLCGGFDTSGQTLMTVELAALQNRHFYLDNIGFDDRQWMRQAPCGGLTMRGRRSVGENGFYQFQLNHLVFETMKDGLTFDGYVFEGLVDAVEGTNCDRIAVLAHDNGNILSNIIFRTPFMRASRMGIDCITLGGSAAANSVMLIGGSFIDITERSISAPNGFKYIGGGIDFENAGHGWAIDVGSADWGMTIENCTGENTDPGRNGTGMPCLIRYMGDPGKLKQVNNRMLYQGTSTFTPDSTVQ